MAGALRKGDKVSCPAWVFDAPGASLEERWSYQTFGGKEWRSARCMGVVAEAKAARGGWKIRWDSDGSESVTPQKHLRVEERAPAEPKAPAPARGGAGAKRRAPAAAAASAARPKKAPKNTGGTGRSGGPGRAVGSGGKPRTAAAKLAAAARAFEDVIPKVVKAAKERYTYEFHDQCDALRFELDIPFSELLARCRAKLGPGFKLDVNPATGRVEVCGYNCETVKEHYAMDLAKRVAVKSAALKARGLDLVLKNVRGKRWTHQGKYEPKFRRVGWKYAWVTAVGEWELVARGGTAGRKGTMAKSGGFRYNGHRWFTWGGNENGSEEGVQEVYAKVRGSGGDSEGDGDGDGDSDSDGGLRDYRDFNFAERKDVREALEGIFHSHENGNSKPDANVMGGRYSRMLPRQHRQSSEVYVYDNGTCNHDCEMDMDLEPPFELPHGPSRESWAPETKEEIAKAKAKAEARAKKERAAAKVLAKALAKVGPNDVLTGKAKSWSVKGKFYDVRYLKAVKKWNCNCQDFLNEVVPEHGTWVDQDKGCKHVEYSSIKNH